MKTYKKLFFMALLFTVLLLFPTGTVQAAATIPADHYIYDINHVCIGYFEGDINDAALSTDTIFIRHADDRNFNAKIQITGISIHLYNGDNIIASDYDEESEEGIYDVHLQKDNTLYFIFDEDNKPISGTIPIVIGNRTFTVSYDIANIYIANELNGGIVYAPKIKVRIKVKNYKGSIKWKSTNKSVATVSKTGIVKTKKAGWSCIIAETPYGKLGYVVNVAKDKKMYKLLKKASYILLHWQYSMEKRGQTGYYDCSSLVWRVYKQYKGITFGTSYYGTTDTELSWCRNNCKYMGYRIIRKKAKKNNLQPGDIGFDYASKKSKSPYHVEIFIGYSFSKFDKKGKPVVAEGWLFSDYESTYKKTIYRPTAKK